MDRIEKIRADLAEINKLCDRWSLTDEYLAKNGHRTREMLGMYGGEWAYGVVMVPDDMVFKVANGLLDELAAREAHIAQLEGDNQRLDREAQLQLEAAQHMQWGGKEDA